jgi:hypothetical protein
VICLQSRCNDLLEDLHSALEIDLSLLGMVVKSHWWVESFMLLFVESTRESWLLEGRFSSHL